MWQTEEDSEARRRGGARPQPGVVVVFSGSAPALRAFPVDGDGVLLGRELLADDRISRQHAHVRAVQGGLAVQDLGSRNGTYVAGKRIVGEAWVHAPTVIRAGRTIALAVDDIARFMSARIDERSESRGVGPHDAGPAVVGPTLAEAWRRVERAGRTGDNLLLTGESGTGKELAARAYHAATGAAGELVSVNCAAIPSGVA